MSEDQVNILRCFACFEKSLKIIDLNPQIFPLDYNLGRSVGRHFRVHPRSIFSVTEIRLLFIFFFHAFIFCVGLLDHVTVLIGIAVDKKAVAGVIHQPYYDYASQKDPSGRTIWGLIGLGAFGHSISSLPTDRRIVTTTRSHNTDLVQEAIAALKADEVIRVGGAGHKVSAQTHAYCILNKTYIR